MTKIRVTIWNEFVQDSSDPEIIAVYPDGIHSAIAEGLQQQLGEQVELRVATLAEPEHGLGAEVLNSTDVLLWWGHLAHDQVSDEVAAAVQQRVLDGMGLIVLHSGQGSKSLSTANGHLLPSRLAPWGSGTGVDSQP